MQEIIPLFPQPLARYRIDPKPWQQELRRVPMERRQYHWYSTSNEITRQWPDLEQALQAAVDDFSTRIMGFTDRPEICISWLNESRRGESTHQHQHPNSMISGCWYWDVVGTSEIHFHKQPTGSLGTWVIKLDERPTQWNSENTSITVTEGDLLLWPSYLQHSVPEHPGPGTRRSLAFNTMPRSWGSDLYAVPPPR